MHTFAISSKNIRYDLNTTRRWIECQSPLVWQGRTSFRFRLVLLSRLRPAGSLVHWDILARWTKALEHGRKFPPLVVNAADDGSYYIQDGNHRYAALKQVFPSEDLLVRVALVAPNRGYVFRRRGFRDFYTYRLEPEDWPVKARVSATAAAAGGSLLQLPAVAEALGL